MLGTESTLISQVASHFTKHGERVALKKPGNVPQAHTLGAVNLDSGALFNTEFDV